MSLSQPSRTIVVEPVQAATAAPAAAEPTPGEPLPRDDAPSPPRPPAQTAAGP
jgi:hypothetical protein